MWKPGRGTESSPTKPNEPLVESILNTTQAFLKQRGIEGELSLDTLLAEIERACKVSIPEPLWGDKTVTSFRQLLESLHP